MGPAVFAIYKKRHIYKISTLIVFYIFTSCITWIGEFVVLGLFNSYAYKPGLYTDQWAENLVGHLILNTTMYPAAATLMVSYSLGYGWNSLIVAFFILMEYLFASLGIYEQHWWKYYISVITVVIFLNVAKKWFYKMPHTHNKLTRTTIYYFVGLLIIHLPIPLLLLAGKQHYSMALIDNITGNMYRSSTIFIFTYHLIEAFIMVCFVCILDKWYWKFMPFVIAFAGQSIMAKLNILIFHNGWNLLYLNLVHALSILIFILIEQYTLKR
jgi:hypothetical protein